MDVQVKAIPLGYKLYVYLDGRTYDNHDPIDAIGFVTPLNPVDNECLIHGVKGELSDEVNLEIAKTLYGLGFRYVVLNVDTGTKVSRYLEYDRTVDGFDVYKGDILKLVESGRI